MITSTQSVLDKTNRTFDGHITVVCDGDEDSERLYKLIEELFDKALANYTISVALKDKPV